MFHVAGFYQSVDTSGVLTTINAINDPSLTVSQQTIQVPEFANFLAGAYAQGATLDRAQLQSPSLRRLANFEISPVHRGTLLTPQRLYQYFFDAPIELAAGEQLQAAVAESAAGAEDEVVIVFLSDGKIDTFAGEIFQVRVSSAVVTPNYSWVNGALTFDQTLPVGRYAIVGADFWYNNGIAFRFVGQGVAHRPGGLAHTSLTDYAPVEQRRGKLGVWLEFHSSTPPTIDYLASGASTSQVGVLDLIALS